MTRTAPPRMIVAFLACCALLAACSGSGTPTTSSTAPAEVGGSASAGAPAPSTPAPSSGTTASALDGEWDGTWQATAGQSGTFSVAWKETGSTLDGTLSISVPCLDGAKVTGTVNGGSIQFGSVKGQCQVDYKGAIDGDQMSGTYDFSGAPGGTWKATKA
jgi:hypothetical protein